MRRLPLICLLVLFLAPALACAEQHIYQWTDANGITHYSDSPPPRGVKYKNLQATMDSVGAASASSSAKTVAAATPTEPAAATKPENIQDTPDNRKKLCTNLSSNMKLLQGSAPLIIDGAEGKQQALSKDGRAKQLATAQAQYNQYCK